MKSSSLTLISDFNLEPLKRFLSNSPALKETTIEVAPFGQVFQSLAQISPSDNSLFFVWTAPEKTLPGFSSAYNMESFTLEDCLKDVEHFADAIIKSSSNKTVFVATWTISPGKAGYGMLDWRPGTGLRHLLAQMNLCLAERLAVHPNIFLLDSERWLHAATPAESPKMWYTSKVPFSPKIFERVAEDLASSMAAIQGVSRRLIVLDLDNTLWGNVIGETGWEGICLGGHDHVGEAYKDFQLELKALSNQGVQLAIVSKNDEAVALEALEKHPEMILRKNDFIGWRINWQDKALNIASLLDEVRLGSGSVVFIDDNAAERDRVANAFPEILTPEWPTDPTAYVTALRKLNCFNSAALSKEDRERKSMYVAERARREAENVMGSSDEWLARLNTRLKVERINKTNQLNLSTRRLPEKEIVDWALQPGRSLLTISASDHFGDMGLVGIIAVESSENKGYLTDFILSCRVMGRQVEETLIHLAANELSTFGAKQMKAMYRPTPRNRPTLDVLKNCGFTEHEQHQFEIDISQGLPKPPSVTLVFNSD
jgi:FkbH-like protein